MLNRLIIILTITLLIISSESLININKNILVNKIKNNIIKLNIINTINDINEFNTITIQSTNTPIVIDFQKSNCKPCQRIAPIFSQLANKYNNKVLFYKVDADYSKECKEVLKLNNIKAVPTFQLWFDGKQIDIIQGAKLDELEESIVDLIEKVEKKKDK